MSTTLTENEVRVLGVLIEKQITTPEYYPLTLNSLTAACNQKNNRYPVMSLTEGEVERALDSLREKNLAYVFHGSTSRVPKYKHVAPEILQLNPGELVVVSVLMLSGPQTIGEIRTRGSRLYDFKGMEEVEETLHALSMRESDPLVVKLPRQAGQKDARFTHLLAGQPDSGAIEESVAPQRPARREPEADRVSTLEDQLQSLMKQIESLTAQFEEFKKEFE